MPERRHVGRKIIGGLFLWVLSVSMTVTFIYFVSPHKIPGTLESGLVGKWSGYSFADTSGEENLNLNAKVEFLPDGILIRDGSIIGKYRIIGKDRIEIMNGDRVLIALFTIRDGELSFMRGWYKKAPQSVTR